MAHLDFRLLEMQTLKMVKWTVNIACACRDMNAYGYTCNRRDLYLFGHVTFLSWKDPLNAMCYVSYKSPLESVRVCTDRYFLNIYCNTSTQSTYCYALIFHNEFCPSNWRVRNGEPQAKKKKIALKTIHIIDQVLSEILLSDHLNPLQCPSAFSANTFSNQSNSHRNRLKCFKNIGCRKSDEK